MASEFRLRLVYADGSALEGEPGRAYPFEIELRGAIRAAIMSRDVGLLKTQAQVGRAIDEGIEEALMGLKVRAATASKR